MSIFSALRNECLVRELQRELNTNVILFGFDNLTYFGNLQLVEDCRVATLTPATLADTNYVKIFTPGGEVEEVEFTRVDLWQVVAKGTSIAGDPFEEDDCDDDRQGAVAEQRQESCALICFLRRMIGDNVAIGTLGGFLFVGVLSDVRDDLAILRVDEIYVQGTSSPICSDDVRSAVVNLQAITSVSSAGCC